jgi:hypothetical protein
MPSEPKTPPTAEPAARTTKRSNTARSNGAKSRGPVTPEGRARSSRNSVRHGLAAPPAGPPPASIVLATESRQDFQLLLDSYLAQFAPAPGVETELVAAMAATRWRLRRLQTIETTLLDNEIVRRVAYINDEFSEMGQDPSNDDRLAYVFKKLADNSQSLALLIRYEGALQRSYDRTFKQLHLLQSARSQSAGSRAQPNEPKPAASPAIAVTLRPVPVPSPPHAPAILPATTGRSSGPQDRSTWPLPGTSRIPSVLP